MFVEGLGRKDEGRGRREEGERGVDAVTVLQKKKPLKMAPNTHMVAHTYSILYPRP